MKKRLEGLPRYSSEKTSVPAELFNLVRLSLVRLGSPLQFPVPGLKNIEIVLDAETWICFDSSLNDIPVLAWTEFEASHRDSLVEPIACQYYTYHVHADKIFDAVVKYLADYLDERLHGEKNNQDSGSAH